jgi:putative Mg2+ transporter-C (MgtC) family protein
MDADFLRIALHLCGALAAGGVIGLERSFHGRPAGFRTHALVALAASLLMTVPMYQGLWLSDAAASETFRTDPTRMAQGIMTGIGFLGAGVIFKDGLSVRGLTTAASIWVTSAIGILIGIGFYLPAALATLLTLGTLSLFRWIEDRLPSHHYAHHVVRFRRGQVMPEGTLRAFLMDQGFTVANMTYRSVDEDQDFEYRMVLRTTREDNLSALAAALRERSDVCAFRLSPTGD